LAIAFILLTIALAIYAYTCGNEVCGYIALVPAVPWLFLGSIDLSDTSFIILFLFSIAINTVLVYFIGAGIQKLFR